MKIEVTFSGNAEKGQVLEAVGAVTPEGFKGSLEEALTSHLEFVVKDLFVKGRMMLIQRSKQTELGQAADGLFAKKEDVKE